MEWDVGAETVRMHASPPPPRKRQGKGRANPPKPGLLLILSIDMNKRILVAAGARRLVNRDGSDP